MALWASADDTRAASADRAQLVSHLESLRRDFDRVTDAYDRVIGSLRLAAVPVVVRDENGKVIHSGIDAVALPGSADALVLERAAESAAQTAMDDPTRSAVLRCELLGPPARTVQLRASVLMSRSGEQNSLLSDPRTVHLGTVVAMDDISEAARLRAVRKELVDNVGHELRTPVGALSILAETLSAEMSEAEPDHPTVRRLAARVEAEAMRLGSLVSDLLALAAADSALPQATVRICDVVDDATSRVRMAAELRDADLMIAPADPSILVRGDHQALVSALTNLLDNAIKYLDPARPGVVEVGVRADARMVWLDVIDNGIGIPPRERDRIWERYHRVDRARAKNTGGSGLGLSIVSEIASAHEGSVALRSVEGQGSTFTLELPRLAPGSNPQ